MPGSEASLPYMSAFDFVAFFLKMPKTMSGAWPWLLSLNSDAWGRQ